MRRLPVLLLALAIAAGCNFDSGAGGGGAIDGGGGGGGDGGTIDGGGGTIDGGGDQADAGTDCADLLPFEPSNFAVCDLVYLPENLTLDMVGTYQLNTANHVLTDPGGGTRTLDGVEIAQTDAPAIFVVFVRTFTLGDTSGLSVRGPSAFALVTRRDLAVDGAMGAPGSGTIPGAGGNNPDACTPGGRGRPGVVQSNQAGTLSGGSGGGGGAFGGAGGQGAVVDGADNPEVTAGGAIGGNATLIPLRGGCSGGAGGDPASNGGPAGGAGGAIQLVAGGVISVPGYVTARGGGGNGVQGPSGGGGGGGSGGGLLLEAIDIEINGALTANGGGGGEGGRAGDTSDSGSNGHDFDGGRASGGSGMTFGGNGGDGGALAGDDGLDATTGFSSDGALAGGGGGGGGIGRIHLRAIGDITIGGFATISPAAQ